MKVFLILFLAYIILWSVITCIIKHKKATNKADTVLSNNEKKEKEYVLRTIDPKNSQIESVAKSTAFDIDIYFNLLSKYPNWNFLLCNFCFNRDKACFLLTLSSDWGDYPLSWLNDYIENDTQYNVDGFTLGKWCAKTDEFSHNILVMEKVVSGSIDNSKLVEMICRLCKDMGYRVEKWSESSCAIFRKIDIIRN